MIRINVLTRELKARLRSRRWSEHNREKHIRTSSEWNKKHPERHRAIRNKYNRKKNGWTSERFEFVRSVQENRCAICSKTFESEPCADHKHVVPPQPRGLLCDSCNSGLGFFMAQPELLELAARYLRIWNGEETC